MNITRLISFSLVALMTALNAFAIEPSEVRWNDMSADTLSINRLIRSMQNAEPDARMIAGALTLLNTPYGASTLEGSPEMLTVRCDSLDCTTFVETLLAAANASTKTDADWRDFLNSLALVRYRRGNVDGYASRLHYISDWIVDNQSKGLIEEITASLPGATVEDKTIDFMSTHPASYPALRDNQENLEAIRNVERGYRNHRFPILKTPRATQRVLRGLKSGDIVAFTTGIRGLDVAHLGIVFVGQDGLPHLLHASSSAGKVVIDSRPLDDYLKHHMRRFTGVRILRPKFNI